MSKIQWATIIPVGVFCLALWLLQSALGTLYAAIEPTCIGGCGNDVANAYGLLSLSTVVSAAAVAWASYRFNTALYRGKGG
ncbi:hypothetical protein [Mesorhizobium sp. M1E.F.Ca.ET.063.01.1.1]|uniref:hypothetical protein n=1 Tax=Mesorhizobium sp. M1E.F.Ca.ET.063.01.1.1 TaxID=2496750 RepID=UPI000FCA3B3A|nr:hypothetical protein [Mesorhizobium sp. M1E.F.Ca.ET.063.01.1.1]RUW85004.1 hypothetical protein EOA29_06810 [Mesorhizobium sp. M1E.F.Ca.ET.063.01.1.1]